MSLEMTNIGGGSYRSVLGRTKPLDILEWTIWRVVLQRIVVQHIEGVNVFLEGVETCLQRSCKHIEAAKAIWRELLNSWRGQNNQLDGVKQLCNRLEHEDRQLIKKGGIVTHCWRTHIVLFVMLASLVLGLWFLVPLHLRAKALADFPITNLAPIPGFVSHRGSLCRGKRGLRAVRCCKWALG